MLAVRPSKGQTRIQHRLRTRGRDLRIHENSHANPPRFERRSRAYKDSAADLQVEARSGMKSSSTSVIRHPRDERNCVRPRGGRAKYGPRRATARGPSSFEARKSHLRMTDN